MDSKVLSVSAGQELWSLMLSTGLLKWGMQRMPVEDHMPKVCQGKFKNESGGLASVLGACGRTGVELLILFGVLILVLSCFLSTFVVFTGWIKSS